MACLSNSRQEPYIQFLRVSHESSQPSNSEQASEKLLNNGSVPGEQIPHVESCSSSEEEDSTLSESGAMPSIDNIKAEPVPLRYGEWVKDHTPDLYEEISLGIQGILDKKVAEYMGYLHRFPPVYLATFSSFIEDVHAAEVADFSSQTTYPSLILDSYEEWSQLKRPWYVRHYLQMDEYELFRRMQSDFTNRLRSLQKRAKFMAEIKCREIDMQIVLESQTWESLGISGFDET